MIKFEGYSLADKGGPGTIFVTDAAGRMPLAAPRRHSPDGFQWGYGGSGPADTAYAILKYILGTEPEPRMYQKFKFDVIADLGSNFTLTEETIREWIKEYNNQ